jgi:hypothetical protein
MSETKLVAQWKVRVMWLVIKDAAFEVIGRTMNLVHSPAKLCPFEYVDPVTDETIYLYTGRRLSVLCVGQRRYYFDRITGKFDGVSDCGDFVSEWKQL